MECRMDKLESQVLPVPPNLIASLRAGFDAIANRIAIILIPLGLDLLLWLGPHLQVKTILMNYVNYLGTSSLNTAQAGDIFSSLMDMLRSLATQYNLLSLLRTFPVGIPSLMATRLPINIPFGAPEALDLANPLVVVGMLLLLILIGLFIGSLYYLLVVQVSLNGKIDLHKIIANWIWSAMQVFSLALALIILFVVISIPSSCIISSITLIGLPLGQFAVFVYLGVILWLAFPLLFSAHGIFVNHNNALVSVQRSMAMTKMTLSTTALFVLCVFTISEGFDILWRVPPENSWLTLIGLGGHAFITSSLLAASFIYYRDADLWTQGMLRLMKSKTGLSLKGG
jgi:hypothetical protein